MQKNPYKPEDPRPGDIIFLPKKQGWIIDISKTEEIEERTGVIVERLKPEPKGGLINYKILVKTANGKTIQTDSQDCKCIKLLLSLTKNFLSTQEAIIKKIEDMARKLQGPVLE